MPNPEGSNQFLREHPYGDVKKQSQLTREAPISGAPLVGSALNAPRRNQRAAVRGAAAPATAVEAPAAAPPATYQAQLAAVWGALASDPEASELIREYAAKAQP